jgi:uncharacterized DUF497 family protein
MRRTPFTGFDWDAGNREKCRKHGLTIEDILEIEQYEKANSGIDER